MYLRAKSKTATTLATVGVLALNLWSQNQAQAETVTAAVAANFVATMQELTTEFEATTPHQVQTVVGSSGKFYAQITQGAPFHLFLSADQAKPSALVSANIVLPQHRFTYAQGRLALWSAKPGQAHLLKEKLITGQYNTLAFANPRLAPYGNAALEALHHLSLNSDSKPDSGHVASNKPKNRANRWVQGENVAQVYQFVITGNADLGLVAASQVMHNGVPMRGSTWLVPGNLHQPIRQDIALLPLGRDNPAALALFDFLRGAKAQQIMASYGYQSLPASPTPAS